MTDVSEIIDQENVPPEDSYSFPSNSKVLTLEQFEHRQQFSDIQNTHARKQSADSEEVHGLGVCGLMEKDDVASSQSAESAESIVAEILDGLFSSVTTHNSSTVDINENCDGQHKEDSGCLSLLPKEGDNIPQYGCDFLASDVHHQYPKVEKDLEYSPEEVIAEGHCSTKSEGCLDRGAAADPNIALALAAETSEVTVDSVGLDSMPTQVDLGAQKSEEKEERQSDLSSEASPAHSCKTDTMSECLSNEKEMLDVNTNPCCQTSQSDVENNEQMLVIQTEHFASKIQNENELVVVSENVLPNGETGNLLTDRRDSFLDTAVPLSARKPPIGVASVNRRPTKSEAKVILDDQSSQIQASNQSEAGPQVAEFTEEEFRSCAEVFKDADSFEFLQKAGSSSVLQESALSRLSLYVKFDPLVKSKTPAKEHNPNNHATDQHIRHANTATKTKLDPNQEESKDKSIPIAKLIDFTPDNRKDTPKSMRMVSVEPLQKEQKLFTDGDMKKAMQIQDLLYRERILSKEREVQDKDKQIQSLEKKNGELQLGLKTTRCMMEEVYSMLRQWQGKFEEDRVGSVESSQKLLKERDQALEDLQSVEAAFADLHRRYEKTKGLLENMKQNETALREQVAESAGRLKKQEQMYEVLRSRSEEKLESANAEIEAARRTCGSEMAVLGAQLKKAEMKIVSLERSLDQKNQEFVELSAIYDELVDGVGQRS